MKTWFFKNRSQCSVVCKWNYIVNESGQVQGWPKDLFQQVGLADLLDDNASRIGKFIRCFLKSVIIARLNYNDKDIAFKTKLLGWKAVKTNAFKLSDAEP